MSVGNDKSNVFLPLLQLSSRFICCVKCLQPHDISQNGYFPSRSVLKCILCVDCKHDRTFSKRQYASYLNLKLRNWDDLSEPFKHPSVKNNPQNHACWCDIIHHLKMIDWFHTFWATALLWKKYWNYNNVAVFGTSCEHYLVWSKMTREELYSTPTTVFLQVSPFILSSTRQRRNGTPHF